MKRWAWIVAGLYGLTFMVLTVPAILAAFAPKIGVSDAFGVYVAWPYWLWFAVMVLSQAALLSVPGRVASRRPVTKGALWPTVLAGGVLAGGLAGGAIFSILEFIFAEHGSGLLFWGGMAAGVLTWCVW